MSATFQTIRARLASGETTLEATVQAYLGRIEATRHLNCYIEVWAAESLERARVLDARFAADPTSVGRLFGMVISLKDVICYAGHGVSASSHILSGFTSVFSATAVERLLAEDAILIGRTGCDEFAMGSSNENSYYGPVRNAANPDLVPGGSSGGSAVSVQADTCLVALGSDTGGSVRQPAAFCGVTGFKPTYGRISRYGLIAYASSFDQIGIIANTTDDIALVLEVIAGPDQYDSTASQKPVPTYSQTPNNTAPKRIAYFREAVETAALHPEIQRVTMQHIAELRSKGHTVEAVDFDLMPYMIPAYYVLTTAEASSNLQRYDGIRYGHRSTAATDLDSTYRRSRTEGFGSEVKRRILLGTFVLSAGYYDAYYTKAQQVRRLIQERTAQIFEIYDFILSPVSPVLPWAIGTKIADPIAVYLADIFTVQANMIGAPAIAYPIGNSTEGLPIGCQIMSAQNTDDALLAFVKGLGE